jgi:hypothetical protein
MWNDANKLIYEAEYIHGKLEGPITRWNSDGNISMSGFAVNNKLHGKYMEKNDGFVRTCQCTEGLIDGKYVITKGNIDILTADMKAGFIDGVLECRHYDGKLMARVGYSQSMLNGEFKIYDSYDDIVLYHGTYVNNIRSEHISKTDHEELEAFNDTCQLIYIRGPLNVDAWVGRYIDLGYVCKKMRNYKLDLEHQQDSEEDEEDEEQENDEEQVDEEDEEQVDEEDEEQENDEEEEQDNEEDEDDEDDEDE